MMSARRPGWARLRKPGRRVRARRRSIGPAALTLCAALGFFVSRRSALADGPCGLGAPEKVAVRAIDARNEPVLADGRMIYLPDIAFPRLAAGRPDIFAQARAELAAWLVGQPVSLTSLATNVDRWGRTAARLYVDAAAPAKPLWVERELVAQGLARVEPGEEADGCAAALLAAETAARSSSLGLWSDPYYSVLPASSPEAFADRAGEMIIVQGRITSMGAAGARTYLNFGPDRRRDLALVVPKLRLKRFDAAGAPLATYVGRMARARGDLDMWFGPRIEIDSPAQIELLAEPPASGARRDRADRR